MTDGTSVYGVMGRVHGKSAHTAGLKVQSWTEVYRFDSYCPGKCEPQGPNGPQDFMTTLNIEHITVPGTGLTWSTKKKDCSRCVSPLPIAECLHLRQGIA